MKYWKHLFEWWQGKSITVRHHAGIGFLVFLMVVVAATGILSLSLVQKADNAIRINTRIQRLIFEMDREMEAARHLHASFFLYYPKIGLQNAHEAYAQPSIRKTAKVVSMSHSLREMISRPGVSGPFQESKIDLNIYLSSAKRFADTSIESFELVTQLAAPGNGLENLVDNMITRLKLQMPGGGDLSNAVHDMENLINKYRIDRKRHLMQSAFNMAFKLENKIKAGQFPDSEQRDQILTLLDRIKKEADQILDIDVAIDSKFNDFVLQKRASHSVSEKFIALANKEVAKAEQQIVFTQNMAVIMLIVITLLGLIAAALIASVLDKNITSRIVSVRPETHGLG